jgi:hypothetical protein
VPGKTLCHDGSSTRECGGQTSVKRQETWFSITWRQKVITSQGWHPTPAPGTLEGAVTFRRRLLETSYVLHAIPRCRLMWQSTSLHITFR